MARYLVTGGAGFIGSNIVEELVRRGKKVRVLDNFSTGNMKNLKPFMKDIELVKGDIRNRATLDKALKGVDYVIHQAALRSVARSVEDPFETNDVNVNGTLNLLSAAKKHKIKRVVYASSSSAYGNAKRFPQKETDLPVPISPYGVSKLAAENYCVTFAKTFGLETVSLRYFNVFGPRQNPESKYSAAIPAILLKMMNGIRPIAEWDGKQSRDFTYVKNVVEANLRSCTAPGVSGEVFNVACGATTSILEIIHMINKMQKTDLLPVYGPKRPGDVKKTIADIGKIKKMLKIKKMIQFEEGLKATVEWFGKR